MLQIPESAFIHSINYYHGRARLGKARVLSKFRERMEGSSHDFYVACLGIDCEVHPNYKGHH